MDNKKRLYEVFSKVNRLEINEQLDVDQAKEQLIDQTKEELKQEFRRNSNIFDAGIPYDMRLNILGEEVNFKLLGDENGVVFDRSIDDQLHYTINYTVTLKGLPFTITFPLTVDLEKVSKGDKMELEQKRWIVPEEIEINYSM